jgi:hypothetical protein
MGKHTATSNDKVARGVLLGAVVSGALTLGALSSAGVAGAPQG